MKQAPNKTVNKKLVLFICTLGGFLSPFIVSSVFVALPVIGKEFTMSAAQVSWVSTLYLLGAAIFLVPFGRLADIYGRKKIFLTGVWIYTILSFILGLANSAPVLLIGRFVQGIGISMVFGTSVAILTSVFEPRERGRVLGINVAAVYLGLSMGPLIGGVLIGLFGWRSLFLLNVPMGLLLILLITFFLHQDWSDAKREKFDFYGSFLYAVMLVAVMYGLSTLSTQAGILCLVFGLATGFLFVRHQFSSPAPLLQLRLFKRSLVFTFSNLAALINYSATAAITFLLSVYLQHIQALPAGTAGLVLTLQPLVMTIVSPLAGKMSDRVEPRLVASAGMALTTVGLFLLSFLDVGSSIYFVLFCLFIEGLGFGLFSSPNTNAVMGAVEKKDYGVASATLGTMRSLGQMLSLGVAAAVYAIVLGSHTIANAPFAQVIHSERILFIFFGVISIAGVFSSLARGKMHG